MKKIIILLLALSASIQGQDAITLEAGSSTGAQSNSSSGIGLSLEAASYFSMLELGVSSVKPGTINGKEFLDLDVKVSALPGFALFEPVVDLLNADLAAIFIAALNVQLRLKQGYNGKYSSLGVGPLYFGVGSEGEYEVGNRFRLGFVAKFAKYQPSDEIKNMIDSASIDMSKYSAKSTLVLDGHLDGEELEELIILKSNENPELFDIETVTVRLTDLQGSSSEMNINGFAAIANIPLKKGFEVFTDISILEKKKTVWSNADRATFSTVEQGVQTGQIDGGISTNKDVTVVEDAILDFDEVSSRMRLFDLNLGASKMVNRRIRVWVDGSYGLTDVKIKSGKSFESKLGDSLYENKVDNFSFKVGARILLLSK